ncbi:AlbA family DNA-binding domain-containing protein [Marinitoga arctica]
MSNLISEKCVPIIIPEIYIKNIKGKNLLIVEIYPGQMKPYFLKEKENVKKAYIRI